MDGGWNGRMGWDGMIMMVLSVSKDRMRFGLEVWVGGLQHRRRQADTGVGASSIIRSVYFVLFCLLLSMCKTTFREVFT